MNWPTVLYVPNREASYWIVRLIARGTCWQGVASNLEDAWREYYRVVPLWAGAAYERGPG